jgi:hypothetical protein
VYQRRCFQSIQPTIDENQELKAQVAHLVQRLKEVEAERDGLEVVAEQEQQGEYRFESCVSLELTGYANIVFISDGVDNGAAPRGGQPGGDGESQGGRVG